MRLVAFEHGGRPALGARLGDRVVPFDRLSSEVPAGAPTPLARGPNCIAELVKSAAEAGTEHTLPLAGLTPPPPAEVICVGLDHVQRAGEGGDPIPDRRAVFLRCGIFLAGAGRPPLRPGVSPRLGYGAEPAVVIGRRAKRVTTSDALARVAGDNRCNHGSVRDRRRKGGQWTAGRSFDATGASGPGLGPADGPPSGAHESRVQARFSGRAPQAADTADAVFPVARLVPLVPETVTLEPDDVVATGTPSGVGHAREPATWPVPGDLCAAGIEGIGVLGDRVADGPAAAAAARAGA